MFHHHHRSPQSTIPWLKCTSATEEVQGGPAYSNGPSAATVSFWEAGTRDTTLQSSELWNTEMAKQVSNTPQVIWLYMSTSRHGNVSYNNIASAASWSRNRSPSLPERFGSQAGGVCSCRYTCRYTCMGAEQYESPKLQY